MPTQNLTTLATLIGDDSHACSFQSLGQYRSALLKAIAQNSALPASVAVPEGWRDVIYNTLRNYRMATLDDGEGCGYPLIDAMTADGQTVAGGIEECDCLADALVDALAAAPHPVSGEQKAERLSVWEGSMPESNGKTNYTAILHKGDISEGMTIASSEYPDRVRYEADEVRWLIGERDERPDILDYDADKHSGYTPPPKQAAQDVAGLVEALHSMTCAYRSAIASGYDRITELGGGCDGVDYMLAAFPDYAKAKDLVTAHRGKLGEQPS